MSTGIQVDIIQGTNDVISRTVTDKNGQQKQYFNQFGYVYLGDAFPVKIKIPLESPAQAYPVGEYELNIRSLRVGRFDALEIDDYNIKLDKI